MELQHAASSWPLQYTGRGLLLQGYLKDQLKGNKKILYEACFEAAIFCCLFHECKERLKKATASRPGAGIVRYICDIALPTPLFGPILGFVLRLAL